jgi:hypothetical protein
MSTAPRSVAQALAFAQSEHDHPTRSWFRDCLLFVQSCYTIPARDATAYDAWLNTPAAHKHVGGDPNDAPVGAGLCYKGVDPAGHIMLAGHITGTEGAWSNDLVHDGAIDKVDRHAPITKWGHTYLGYITQIEGYDLPIVPPAPPKEPVVPISTPHIDNAIAELGIAIAIRKPGPVRYLLRTARRAAAAARQLAKGA